jgi:hypothetical protein
LRNWRKGDKQTSDKSAMGAKATNIGLTKAQWAQSRKSNLRASRNKRKKKNN